MFSVGSPELVKKRLSLSYTKLPDILNELHGMLKWELVVQALSVLPVPPRLLGKVAVDVIVKEELGEDVEF